MVVTQGDVAARAGVARRTVSNVINDFPHVSQDVRQRVRAAIDELGYRPNRAAQSLRTGRTGTLGLILPELDIGYFAEIARLLIEEAEQRGFTVLVAQTLGMLSREIAVLDKFVGQQPDGLIFSPIRIDTSTLQDRIRKLPHVLLGEHHVELERDHVAIDNVAASRAVVQHLVDCGRSSIAFIGRARSGELQMADLRLRGYADALLANGLPVEPHLIRVVDGYHRSHGFAAMKGLLRTERHIDAVFGATDLLALGAIRALADAGIHVPDQVAVAGFDDLDEGRFAVPRLTTVSPHKANIARAALELLIARIDGDHEAGHRLGRDEFTIQIRESSSGRLGSTGEEKTSPAMSDGDHPDARPGSLGDGRTLSD